MSITVSPGTKIFEFYDIMLKDRNIIMYNLFQYLQILTLF